MGSRMKNSTAIACILLMHQYLRVDMCKHSRVGICTICVYIWVSIYCVSIRVRVWVSTNVMFCVWVSFSVIGKYLRDGFA